MTQAELTFKVLVFSEYELKIVEDVETDNLPDEETHVVPGEIGLLWDHARDDYLPGLSHDDLIRQSGLVSVSLEVIPHGVRILPDA